MLTRQVKQEGFLLSNDNENLSNMNLDTKILSNFIIEFNISLRLVTSYPKNHPIITASIHKVLHLLDKLLEFREEISLAIARDSLMFEYALLDPKNPVYKNLANILFNHNIASITFQRAITADELVRFNEIMLQKCDSLRESGGVQRAVKELGLSNILIQEINYGNFSTTEEDRIDPAGGKHRKREASTLWEDFAHGILEGSLDPLGTHSSYASVPDPGILAEMMNKYDNRAGFKEESYADVITSFMGELGQGEGNLSSHTDSLEKLSMFVSKLNPAIRRQFLNGVFTHPGMNQGITKEILATFPNDIILDALEDINSRESYKPPVTISLLQRLSKTTPTEKGKKTVSAIASVDDHQLADKMRIIFQEDKSDEFIPTAYQESLRAITSMRRISIPELEEIEELRKTLFGHSMETQLCKVILEAMKMPSDKCKPEALEKNLLEILDYFLDAGDFSFLAEIFNHLHSLEQLHFQALYDYFTGQYFLDKVLDCLETWDKTKQPDICFLVLQIGKPFVEPLLDRLSEEKNISLRRSYLDCLLALGDKVRGSAIERLTDSRWYFVRNLIIILRELNDLSVLAYIRKIRDHRHPRVRQEVIKTFQLFNHSEADRLLLQDMQSSERELLLNAIQLAEKSRNKEVFSKLLSFLTKGGFTNSDFEIKSAVVRTLAQIKNDQALPSLMRYVRSKHLFLPNSHNRLKVEIIKSFQQYKAESVRPLLDELAISDQDELVLLAKETLYTIQGEA